MDAFYLPSTELDSWLGGDRARTMLLAGGGGEASPGLGKALGKPRAPASIKPLLLPAIESVGRYGASADTGPPEAGAEPIVAFGLRACELRAIAYLDGVLLDGPFQDPRYAARREALTLISADCPEPAESCFCTLVGGGPFATEGFDANLTPVDGGFVVEVATEAGRAWLDGVGGAVEADENHVRQRQGARDAAGERLAEQNARFIPVRDAGAGLDLPDEERADWQAFAGDCVECAACTNICPTCHCFYLFDQTLGDGRFERVRTWDSCLTGTYHRMAGTSPELKPTPRPRLRSRLANRVLHKFTWSPKQVGRLGCVGCGRCIDACLGAIDLREVVSDLAAEPDAATARGGPAS